MLTRSLLHLDTIEPDVEKAIATLGSMRDKVPPQFLGVYNGKPFFKEYPTGVFGSYSKVLTDVTDVIQATREAAPARSLKTQYAGAMQGFLLAHGNRIADQSEGLVDAMDAKGINAKA